MTFRAVVYSTREMAARWGVTTVQVAYWCRAGLVVGCQRLNRQWVMLPTAFLITPPPLGRPPGAKNKKPYPKGVKRPRKTPAG